MPHPALLQRLAGYRAHLIAVYKSGAGMSSAAKGNERRAFVHDFLEATFPPPNRFGTGDCIDKAGNQSGESDVVVEYPFLPSLTLQGHGRLYLAEGIAAVIEVKSNISGQWKEACDTGTKLKALQRNFVIGMSMGPVPLDIPYFVVGTLAGRTWTRSHLIAITRQPMESSLSMLAFITRTALGCRRCRPLATSRSSRSSLHWPRSCPA
jgi:hypothetical protein